MEKIVKGNNSPGAEAKSATALSEEHILGTWAKEGTFEESLKIREGAERFVFYDGPPFANGLPHMGHMMTSALKDAVARYQTMRGFSVPRRFGWDCHGLPPEMLAEKELGIAGKKAINIYGIDKFNDYCRESVLRFSNDWHEWVVRVGRWVDFKDDYRTMDQSYMESVMWAFKSLYEKGLVYEGERVVPYSYGAHTALSNFETRQDDSLRDREDLTATVKFALQDGRFLLGWTTTPWTLPANLLLAINAEMDYVEMHLGEEQLILAAEALERYAPELEGATEQARFKGSVLLGQTYTPLFPYFVGSANSFQVVQADFVEPGEGTGVVHIAPGHGEDDYWLGKQLDTPIISPVDDDGRFTDEVKDYVGRLVFDANGEIVADLAHTHQLFKSETLIHKYPHCWRTDVPIIYRAMSAWFVKVPEIKDQLLAANQEINWVPSHYRDGAFGKWLENARDWNVSRKRFWGAPLPVWKTDDGELLIMGSIEEIKERAVDPSLVTDLHRPYIDAVELKTDSGKIAYRVDDVFDCWFESGSMPFAQQHYPFENKAEFEAGHPADFITEYAGQTRGWFYTLHVMSVALFGKPAFKTAVAHGILLGADGRKLSKRLNNYPDMTQTFGGAGADAIRYYLFSSALFSGETAAYDPQSVQEAQRNVIQRLRNVHGFFTTYAAVDGWLPGPKLTKPDSKHVLDTWILARLEQVTGEMTAAADSYDTPRLTRWMTEFLDDLSNWYVRRSRRRFWKSEDDGDKTAAYLTLHFVLARTTQLLAPWAPFVSDEIWRSIMFSTQEPVSVHLSSWPTSSSLDDSSDKQLSAMVTARQAVTEGLRLRALAGVKVRQPLSRVDLYAAHKLSPSLVEIVQEELNVKQVVQHTDTTSTAKVELNTELTPELRTEGLARDIIRQIQEARKAAGLQVDDRINLALLGHGTDLTQAVAKFRDLIMTETLATDLDDLPNQQAYQSTVKLAGQELTIGLTARTR